MTPRLPTSTPFLTLYLLIAAEDRRKPPPGTKKH